MTASKLRFYSMRLIQLFGWFELIRQRFVAESALCYQPRVTLETWDEAGLDPACVSASEMSKPSHSCGCDFERIQQIHIEHHVVKTIKYATWIKCYLITSDHLANHKSSERQLSTRCVPQNFKKINRYHENKPMELYVETKFWRRFEW